ncbi:MAG TPA: HIT family protein [Methanomicrobiales archaeon]|nr:HIT family protein [Methanomicrobiales archaeon]
MNSNVEDCPFCNPPEEAIVLRNDLCYALWDKYPVAKGHMLIVPFRHVPLYFDTTYGEKVAILDLAEKARDLTEREFSPDGYNFGVNIGEYAGQSVMHVHFHFIPRYRGDVPDVEGGIRKVIATMCKP